ncbi:MAG: cytochrome c oxidase subunit II [Myxococcota bacterium]|nr:cytochrome C oxidase subunit II [Spirochaeta sp.]RPG07234.1 MAG: cytochrome C oxidase subunit II [Proteobacteria bacterium TMED72]
MIQSYLAQGSTYAGDIDFLFDMIFWIVGVWFLISSGVFFWLVFKFRVSGNEGTAQYITGEEKSQKRWITIPHLLVLVCDVFIIWGAVRVWYDIKQHLPEPDREVRVITQQWAWTFVHPGQDGNFDTADDIHTVNELRLEKDAVYHYHLTSNDVMHDFSVPVFRLKQDAIPGRVITGWFTPTLLGEFDIQCAEICGIGHGLMPARLVVESAADHAAWMTEQSPVKFAAVAPQVGEN